MILKPRTENNSLQCLRSRHTQIGFINRAYTSSVNLLHPPKSRHRASKSKRSSVLSFLPINTNQNGSIRTFNSLGDIVYRDSAISLNEFDDSVSHLRNSQSIMSSLSELQRLPNCDKPNFSSILDKKLEICNILCNFQMQEDYQQIINMKKKSLEEILEKISNPSNTNYLDDDSVTKIAMMCKHNICRQITKLQSGMVSVWGNEDDLPPICEPSWPHLFYVYQILRRLINSFKNKSIFSMDFVIDLLPIMHSPDQNERTALKAIIAQFYKVRPKNISNDTVPKLMKLLEEYKSSKQPPFIVVPILELLDNIFQLDIIDTAHIRIYFQCLLSLFSDSQFAYFEKSFLKLVDFFTDENPIFAAMVVRSLISHWPVSCIEKEASFLRVLTDIFPKVGQRDRAALMKRIFSIYAKCTISNASKVAESALNIWTSTQIEHIIQENAKVVIPILIVPVQRVLKEHWNSKVRETASTVYRMISRTFPKLLKSISTANNTNPNDNDEMKNWVSIARAAAYTDKNLVLSKKLAEMNLIFNKKQNPSELSKITNKHLSASDNRFSLSI